MKESGKDLIKINQQLKRIEIKEFEIENQIVFNYFDNLPVHSNVPSVCRKHTINITPH